MNNYKVLFMLRLLKSTMGIFTGSFLVLYFMNLSSNNILPLGIYYLIIYFTLYFTIFFLKNFSKKRKRIYLFRIAVVFNLFYYFLIVFLKEKIIDYFWLLGILHGLEEGFYYSVYNNFESSISNEKRNNFLGTATAISSLIKIIVPVFLGSLISLEGFSNVAIIILFLVLLQLILSFIFVDNNLEYNKKANMKEFKNVTKQNKLLSKLKTIYLLNGFIFSGAFSKIVTIYIIKVFSDNLSLGIFESLFAIVISLSAFAFAKFIPKEKYNLILKISGFCTVLSLYILMFNVSFLTVVIFNFFQSFAATLINLIIENAALNLSNDEEIKKHYKVEYFVCMEKSLFWGRFGSYLIFILLAFSNGKLFDNFILSIFVIIIVLLVAVSSELYDELNKEK